MVVALEQVRVEAATGVVVMQMIAVEAVDLDAMTVTFSVECSKGTYIRTICQDVGLALGTGAVMTSLVRLASGRFTIEDAVTLDELAAMKEEAVKEAAVKEAERENGDGLPPDDSWIDGVLLPPDYPLIHFGRVLLNPELSKKFVDGWHISLRDCRIEEEPE